MPAIASRVSFGVAPPVAVAALKNRARQSSLATVAKALMSEPSVSKFASVVVQVRKDVDRSAISSTRLWCKFLRYMFLSGERLFRFQAARTVAHNSRAVVALPVRPIFDSQRRFLLERSSSGAALRAIEVFPSRKCSAIYSVVYRF